MGFFRQLADGYEQTIEAGLVRYHSKRPTTRRGRIIRAISQGVFFALCIAGVVALRAQNGSIDTAGVVGVALTGGGFGLVAWSVNRRVVRRIRASTGVAKADQLADVHTDSDPDC